MAAPETTEYTWNITIDPNQFGEIYHEEGQEEEGQEEEEPGPRLWDAEADAESVSSRGTIDLITVRLQLPSSDGDIEGTANWRQQLVLDRNSNIMEYEYKLQPDEKQQLGSGRPVNIKITAHCEIGPNEQPVCRIHSALFDAEPFLFYPNPSAWGEMTIARSQGGGRKSNSKRNKKLKKSKYNIKMVRRTKRTKKRTKQRGGKISSGYYFGNTIHPGTGQQEVIGYTSCSEPIIEGMDSAFQAASNLKGGKKRRQRRRKTQKRRKSRKSRKSRKKTRRRR